MVDLFREEMEILLPHIEESIKMGDFEMYGSNQDGINEITLALVKRVEILEAQIENLKKQVVYEWQLVHQIKRIDDIEEKIDWSKKGKI